MKSNKFERWILWGDIPMPSLFENIKPIKNKVKIYKRK